MPAEATDDSSEALEPDEVETQAEDYSGVNVDTEEYTYSSEYIEVSIETPRLTGLQDSAVQDRINSIFSEYAQMSKAGIEALGEESRQMAEEGYSAGKYGITVCYEVMYLKNGFLSLALWDYVYLGGAHGSTIQLGYTFNLGTGELLSLDDLMQPGSSYKSFINSTIIEEIASRVDKGELSELAHFEDIGDTANWYLTDDAIVFYFQPYEYFPYAAGIQLFPLI